MPKSSDSLSLDQEVTGTTFQVYTYLYLHPKRGVGPREIQRALGFRSPSSAIFQLEKLRDRRLATKHRDGTYQLANRYKLGPLRDYVNFRAHFIPRIFFYALTLTTITGILTVFFLRYGNPETILAIIPTITVAIALWTETYNTWKRRPKLPTNTQYS